MICPKLIVEKDDIERLSTELLGNHTLPAFLFDETKYIRVVIGMKVANNYVGMSYGVIAHNTEVFFLHFLYISKDYRRCEFVIHLLEFTLKSAVITAEAKKAIWKYVIYENMSDVHLKLLSMLPFCHVTKITKIKSYQIKTKDFEHIRLGKFISRNSHSLKNSKYSIVRWFECDNRLKEMMFKIETSIKHDKNYLSPFIEDEISWQGSLDEQTSLVLVKRDVQEPLGWIICSKLSDKKVQIERLYIYEDKRVGFVAAHFLAYVLDKIKLLYEQLCFNVIEGNQQMKRFVNYFNAPIVDMDYSALKLSIITCKLEIVFERHATE
ncbi:MAG: hypothetical protein FWC32_06345 [Firmicutes bacterium]|nr:hypothetical protein [Bacillota bacterium]